MRDSLFVHARVRVLLLPCMTTNDRDVDVFLLTACYQVRHARLMISSMLAHNVVHARLIMPFFFSPVLLRNIQTATCILLLITHHVVHA